MVISYEQPELGEIKQLGFPIKLSRTPASVERPAPALGEHTAELLMDAGYSAEEVKALEESGAAKGPDDARARDSATRIRRSRSRSSHERGEGEDGERGAAPHG